MSSVECNENNAYLRVKRRREPASLLLDSRLAIDELPLEYTSSL